MRRTVRSKESRDPRLHKVVMKTEWPEWPEWPEWSLTVWPRTLIACHFDSSAFRLKARFGLEGNKGKEIK